MSDLYRFRPLSFQGGDGKTKTILILQIGSQPAMSPFTNWRDATVEDISQGFAQKIMNSAKGEG